MIYKVELNQLYRILEQTMCIRIKMLVHNIEHQQ